MICAICGGRPVQRHHVTGRPAPGTAYLDIGLTLPLCPVHHRLLHQGWRLAGLDGPRPADELRLLRGGVLLRQLGAAGRPLPATCCEPFGRMLVSAAGRLP